MKPLNRSALLAETASLADVLRVFGGHNWSADAIETHKKEELAKAHPVSRLYPFKRPLKLLLDTFLGSVILFALYASSTGFSISLVAWATASAAIGIASFFALTIPFWAEIVSELAPGLVVYTLLALLTSTLSLSGLIWLSERRIYGPAEWQTFPFDEYRRHYGLVPKEAARLALHARSLKPRADVKVHTLIQDSYVLDPILEVDGFYLLVWDDKQNIVSPPV